MRSVFTVLLAVLAVLAPGAMCDDADTSNSRWENTELTTATWRTISTNDEAGLAALYHSDPKAFIAARAADGRGALFWAYEYGRPRMASMLIIAGADESAEDAQVRAFCSFIFFFSFLFPFFFLCSSLLCED
jgi:hypothetical protein